MDILPFSPDQLIHTVIIIVVYHSIVIVSDGFWALQWWIRGPHR